MAGKKLTFAIKHPKDCKCWLCKPKDKQKEEPNKWDNIVWEKKEKK